MSNGLILTRSWTDGLAINVSSEAGDLVGDNLINHQPSETWLSNEVGDPQAWGDFGQRRPCDAFALWNHNLTVDDTVTLELAEDAAFTEDLVQHTWPGLYPPYGWGEQPWDLGGVGGHSADSDDPYNPPIVVETFDLTVRLHHRFTVTRDGGGDTEIGEYMIGQALRPATNFDWGIDIGWVPATELQRMSGNQHRPGRIQQPYREGTITWSWFEYADARSWHDMVRRIGRDQPILFVPYPDEQTTLAREQIILAWITHVSKPRLLETDNYAVTLELREAL